MAFQVGDLVRYALRSDGGVAVVTEIGVSYRDDIGRIRHDGVRLDSPTRNLENIARGRRGNAIYSPGMLKHDDGNPNQVVEWDACVWRPRVSESA